MNWLNLLILLILSAGHAELMVALINRVDSLPIARPMLHLFRRVVDAAIVFVPFAMIWSMGLQGPRLLWEGNWTSVPLFWRVYFALCAAGAAGLIGSAVRWWFTPLPAALISNHSRTVDVVARLGYRPVGSDLMRLLARIPGNEIFRVQVSDKRYCLPRVPREWDGLSILHLSDTHFTGTVQRPFFEEIARLAEEMSPDLIVFTGDLLDDLKLIEWLPHTIGRLKAPLGCYFILGNHDWWFGPARIREEFARCGWQDVSGRVVDVERHGNRLQIGGCERPWMGDFPIFSSRDDAFRILLSHTPDNFAWARRQNVDLVLAGHNHGGQIVLPIVGPLLAPSRHGVRYASGAFWSKPTLLYVSRGLSGRHPVRLNCPPELTRIILESPQVQARKETDAWSGG